MLVLPFLAMAPGDASPSRPAGEGAVGALLDRFHAAAARADFDAYFACFAPEGVFLGTDPGERWTVEQFRAYARPLFSAGRGWAYVPVERHVVLGRRGRVAWFDEVLRHERHGTLRGTGTCVEGPDGWRVAQYSLTFLVPNERAAAVVAAMVAPAEGEP